jgi:SAM-dependent methyltransferase
MSDYIERTVAAYDDTATYENSTREMVPLVELDQFLGMLSTGASVLDAGCAYGRDTQYLSSRGINARGVDLSSPLIKRARELYPDIEFSVADVRNTGFDNEALDGIWCHATLLHLNDEDMHSALLEFKRILRPNGILAVSLKKGEGIQEFVEGFSSKSERFFNFKTHDTFAEQLGRAGLQEVEWHYMNERERYSQDKRDLDWLYSFSKKPSVLH